MVRPAPRPSRSIRRMRRDRRWVVVWGDAESGDLVWGLDEATRLAQRAQVLYQKYEDLRRQVVESGEGDAAQLTPALDTAIKAMKSALAKTPRANSHHATRMYRLASAYLDRYMLTDRRSALAEALKVF